MRVGLLNSIYPTSATVPLTLIRAMEAVRTALCDGMLASSYSPLREPKVSQIYNST